MRTCSKCRQEKPLECFSKKLKGLQPNCKQCTKVVHAGYREANRERLLQRAKQMYAANRETLLARQKEYYSNNQAERLEYIRKWREENPNYSTDYYAKNAETAREKSRQWKRDNPERTRMQEKAKRSAKRRIPSWANRDVMTDIYRYAKIMRTCGVDCHVDHKIPLRGKTACGFHSDANLTVLLAEDNLKKGAKLL